MDETIKLDKNNVWSLINRMMDTQDKQIGLLSEVKDEITSLSESIHDMIAFLKSKTCLLPQSEIELKKAKEQIELCKDCTAKSWQEFIKITYNRLLLFVILTASVAIGVKIADFIKFIK